MAGSAMSAIASAVHSGVLWTDLIGRGWLKSMISFARTAKIWPLTFAARSLRRKTAIGATLRDSIFFNCSTRSFSSGVFAGIELVMRLHAKGAMQFERTL